MAGARAAEEAAAEASAEAARQLQYVSERDAQHAEVHSSDFCARQVCDVMLQHMREETLARSTNWYRDHPYMHTRAAAVRQSSAARLPADGIGTAAGGPPLLAPAPPYLHTNPLSECAHTRAWLVNPPHLTVHKADRHHFPQHRRRSTWRRWRSRSAVQRLRLSLQPHTLRKPPANQNSARIQKLETLLAERGASRSAGAEDQRRRGCGALRRGGAPGTEPSNFLN